MSHPTPEEIKHHVKIYINVFIALAVLTVLTVAVGYLHLPFAAAVIVALLIASIKGSLVAAFFMHLSAEKKIIYAILILTVIFFFSLLLTPVFDKI